MRTVFASVGATLAAILALGGIAAAHHGWSQYNADQALTLAGTVREAAFEHPHAMMRLDVSGKTWLVVLPPPTRARGLGLTPETVRPGMRVSVEGHPHRSTADEVRALRITVGERAIRLR